MEYTVIFIFNFKWHDLILQRVTEAQNTVRLTDRMWARLLASTNQPSFLNCSEVLQETVDCETIEGINSKKISSI